MSTHVVWTFTFSCSSHVYLQKAFPSQTKTWFLGGQRVGCLCISVSLRPGAQLSTWNLCWINDLFSLSEAKPTTLFEFRRLLKYFFPSNSKRQWTRTRDQVTDPSLEAARYLPEKQNRKTKRTISAWLQDVGCIHNFNVDLNFTRVKQNPWPSFRVLLTQGSKVCQQECLSLYAGSKASKEDLDEPDQSPSVWTECWQHLD